MMTAVLAVLCLYLAACYAYGGYLLVNVLRGHGRKPAASAEVAGPRAGILRVTEREDDGADERVVAVPTRAAA